MPLKRFVSSHLYADTPWPSNVACDRSSQWSRLTHHRLPTTPRLPSWYRYYLATMTRSLCFTWNVCASRWPRATLYNRPDLDPRPTLYNAVQRRAVFNVVQRWTRLSVLFNRTTEKPKKIIFSRFSEKKNFREICEKNPTSRPSETWHPLRQNEKWKCRTKKF